MSGRQLHLDVNLLHSGVYPSAWRLPQSRPDAFLDLDHFVRVARVPARLCRRDYAGATLRDHLGLPRPVSRFAAMGASA